MLSTTFFPSVSAICEYGVLAKNEQASSLKMNCFDNTKRKRISSNFSVLSGGQRQNVIIKGRFLNLFMR